MTWVLVFDLAYALALSFALARAGVRNRMPSAARGTGRESPQRVLIVGATGGTGRQLVEQALARGFTVTALVRKPDRLALKHPKLRVARGDVLDYESVLAVMAGQDAVVSALGHGRFIGPSRVLSRGTHHLLRAMQACGVPRLICETSLGLGDSAGRLGLWYTFFTIPVILPFYFWDKTRQERSIAASDREWVIVRPGVLTNSPPRGKWQAGPGVGSYLWTVRVSRADVAAFMLDRLTSDQWLSGAVGLAWRPMNDERLVEVSGVREQRTSLDG
jgi:uncharacterized protein YbjT (DUF2867 family)